MTNIEININKEYGKGRGNLIFFYEELDFETINLPPLYISIMIGVG